MKYLLSIYADERGFASATPEQIQQTIEAYNSFTQEEVRAARRATEETQAGHS